ncbi:hypothetical protein TNCV_3294681 [Trichonephila clavipes]|nr:hypothetical protein TNCV_3294681 [Trichonephila clavipes]
MHRGQTFVRTSVHCPPRRHCFLKLFSRHPPRHQSPESDGPPSVVTWQGFFYMYYDLQSYCRCGPRDQTIDNDPKATCAVFDPPASHLL